MELVEDEVISVADNPVDLLPSAAEQAVVAVNFVAVGHSVAAG